MMPAANQGVGMNLGFPDVCTTPAAPAPIPIPYPNIGMNAMAMPFVPNVLVSFAPAQNMAAKPLLTNGDNAGVAHPLFMQPGGTTVGKPNLLVGGMPAGHLTNPTYGNNFNNPVGAKIVPSITNVLMGYTPSLTPSQRAFGARLVRSEGSSMRCTAGLLQLRIPCIGLGTDRWLARGLSRLRGVTIRAVALDLRGNPGGVLTVAARLALLLLRLDVPIAVAIDRDTASAAELLATALDARTFGERTFGKARATTFDVHAADLSARGDAPTVTFARAGGETIDGVGLPPDQPCAPEQAHAESIAWLQTRRAT
jgi:carboxyl-terminal processing protease